MPLGNFNMVQHGMTLWNGREQKAFLTGGASSVASFSTFKVYCFDDRFLTLKWSVDDIPIGADYSFDIYRSESPEGPWDLIRSGLKNREIYHDWDVNLYNQWRTTYYKIHYIVSGDQPVESDIENVRSELDAIGLDIVRRNNLILWLKNGKPGFFLIERTWGARCSECFNPTAQKITKSHCPMCYGTRYNSGYFEPIFGYVCQLGLGSRESRITPLVELQQGVRQFWTSNYPILKPRDIFIDNNNTRWRIKSVHPTEKLGAVMRQIFSADELQRDDVIYDLDVPNINDAEPIRDYHVWRETAVEKP